MFSSQTPRMVLHHIPEVCTPHFANPWDRGLTTLKYAGSKDYISVSLGPGGYTCMAFQVLCPGTTQTVPHECLLTDCSYLDLMLDTF